MRALFVAIVALGASGCVVSGDPLTVTAYAENTTSTAVVFDYVDYDRSSDRSIAIGENEVALLASHTTTSDAVPLGGDLVIDGRLLVNSEVVYEIGARDFEPWPERSTATELAHRFVITDAHVGE